MGERQATLRLHIDPQGAEHGRDRAVRSYNDIKRASRGVVEGSDQITNSWERMQRRAITLQRVAGVLAASFAVREVLRTASAYEQLRARLETVEGSATGAAVAFNRIVEFAARTPFEVDKLTEAFVLLRAIGVNPTTERLTAFGNIAAGFGRDITDVAAAVQGAITGEMERLKAFGIVARQEGDKVRFIFQNTETTVAKEAGAIVGYLEQLGNTKFAGAMERQAHTLEGAFSNLEDASASFADQVGRAGLVDALSDVTRELTQAIEQGTELADLMGGTLAAGVHATGEAAEFAEKHWEAMLLVGTALGARALLPLERQLAANVVRQGEAAAATLRNTLALGEQRAAIEQVSAARLRQLPLELRAARMAQALAAAELREAKVGFLQAQSAQQRRAAAVALTAARARFAQASQLQVGVMQRATLAANAEAAALSRLSVTARVTTVAMGGLRRALELLGGPVGLVLIAAEAFFLLSRRQEAVADTSETLLDKLEREAELVRGLTEDTRKLNEQRATTARVALAQTEAQLKFERQRLAELRAEADAALQAAAKATSSLGNLFSREGIAGVAGLFGVSADDILEQQAAVAKLSKEAERWRAVLDAFENAPDPVSGGDAGKASERVQKLEAGIRDLREQLEAVQAGGLDRLARTRALQEAREVVAGLGEDANVTAEEVAALILEQQRLESQLDATTKRIEDQAKAVQDAREGLLDLLDKVSEETELLRFDAETRRQVVTLREAEALAIAAGIKNRDEVLLRLHDELDLQRELAQVKRDAEAARSEAERIVERTRTPEERFGAEVARLNELLSGGFIDEETFARAVRMGREEFERLTDQERDAERAAQDFANVIGKAFEDAVIQGNDLRAVMVGLLEDIERIILRVTVTKPLENFLTGALSGAVGGLFGGRGGGVTEFNVGSGAGGFGGRFAADGAVYDRSGEVQFFASGGVVDRPTAFRFASGAGVMGEAGPEAILPLKRLPGGELGVQAESGGEIVVHFAPVTNIDARGSDPESIARLQRMLDVRDRQLEDKLLVKVADARQRGGGMRKAFKGR